MSTPGFNRRHFCGVAAASVVAAPLDLFGLSRRLHAMTDVMPDVAEETAVEGGDIRPFRVSFSDAELTELHRRIKATRWPERETVADATQGVQFATMQKLARLLGDGSRLAEMRSTPERAAAIHDRRSTDWTSTSFTSARSTRTRCRSSSRTDGRARSSSSSRSSSR